MNPRGRPPQDVFGGASTKMAPGHSGRLRKIRLFRETRTKRLRSSAVPQSEGANYRSSFDWSNDRFSDRCEYSKVVTKGALLPRLRLIFDSIDTETTQDKRPTLTGGEALVLRTQVASNPVSPFSATILHEQRGRCGWIYRAFRYFMLCWILLIG